MNNNTIKEELNSFNALCKSNDKIFWSNTKKTWICYGYHLTQNLLRNKYLFSKSRLDLPIEMFESAEDKKEVLIFQEKISSSLIFRDEIRTSFVKWLMNKASNVNFLDSFDNFNNASNEVVNLAEHSFNFNKDVSLLITHKLLAPIIDEAVFCGDFFDGKISSKEHFLEIAKSFNYMVDFISKNDEIKSDLNMKSEKDFVDLLVIFIAAQSTTSHLINCTIALIIENLVSNNIKIDKNSIEKYINESLRMYSPVTAVSRQLVEDYQLEGGALKKGERILFRLDLANYDSHFGLDIYDFIPSRKFKPLSFGVSPYQCVGMGLSLNATKFYISQFLSNFNKMSIRDIGYTKGTASFGIDKLMLEVSHA
ncbi:cytochrome P450 [Vibrio kanaloae]|uniref:cytochrome P450 n=1 Tax=Vibrio kanaloae TaxID=170673 RepID=UPI0010BF63EF|nr:cytochrome P450 [Vibrio kanaloae]TKF17472.1 cytochrome P450 [Vibrio kanaloae]